jgi:hypothetical protein
MNTFEFGFMSFYFFSVWVFFEFDQELSSCLFLLIKSQDFILIL